MKCKATDGNFTHIELIGKYAQYVVCDLQKIAKVRNILCAPTLLERIDDMNSHSCNIVDA